MIEYPKIKTVFNRDSLFKVIEGDWSLPEFEFLKDNLWVATEKIDGTNIRVCYDPPNVIFKGRTDKAQIPSDLLDRLAELFTAEKFQKIFDGPVCLYGEGFGGKIQKVGKLYRDKPDFILFDVLIGNLWLERVNVNDIANQLGIEVVPICCCQTLNELVQLVKQGNKSNLGNLQMEGFVARPSVELNDRRHHRIICKLKTKDFAHENLNSW